MSIFNKLKRVPQHLPTGTAHSGMSGFLLDKGERYAAAYGFGYAKGMLGEKFLYRGHGLDLWVGAGLTLGSAVLNAMSYGRSSLASHMERVGDAGVMSALNSLGASMGLDKAGRSVAVLTPGKNAKGLPGKSAVQGIDAAPKGPYLSADDIARYAAGARRG